MEVPGVLDSADSCGFWLVPVADHLYVNVAVTEAGADCSAAMGAEVALFAEPIFTDMSNEPAKWTFDVVGVSPTGDFASVDVTCSEGSSWAARISVP